MLIPPMLTEVALEVPSEFWLLFWLVLPEVPTAAWPLVLPWFWTALRTVVGLSADAGRTTSNMVAKVIADSTRFMWSGSPKWRVPRSGDPGGEPRGSPPGSWTLLHYGYCEINVWLLFWFGFELLPTAACPAALPTLPWLLMVVVMSFDEPPLVLFPPSFWISTPRTSPLLTRLLLLFPMFATPRFWPPMLIPPSAHCPFAVILIAGVGRAGPGRVTVILRRPGRRALRVVTTSTTRGRSRCTGVDAGVVGRTRATATRGRGTAGTASATSAALTADGTSTTRPGVTALPTDRTVTRRGGRAPCRSGGISTVRRRVTTGGASRRAGRLRTTDLGEPTRSGVPTRAGAVTTSPARTGTAGRVGVTTRPARTRTTGAGRTSRTGTTRSITTGTARAGATGPASATVRATGRSGRTCATRTGRTSTAVGSTTSTAVTAGSGPARPGATRGGSARSGGTCSITTGTAASGTASTAARVTRGVTSTAGSITGTTRASTSRGRPTVTTTSRTAIASARSTAGACTTRPTVGRGSAVGGRAGTCRTSPCATSSATGGTARSAVGGGTTCSAIRGTSRTIACTACAAVAAGVPAVTSIPAGRGRRVRSATRGTSHAGVPASARGVTRIPASTGRRGRRSSPIPSSPAITGSTTVAGTASVSIGVGGVGGIGARISNTRRTSPTIGIATEAIATSTAVTTGSSGGRRSAASVRIPRGGIATGGIAGTITSRGATVCITAHRHVHVRRDGDARAATTRAVTTCAVASGRAAACGRRGARPTSTACLGRATACHGVRAGARVGATAIR